MSAIGRIDPSKFVGTDEDFTAYLLWLQWLERWRSDDLREISKKIRDHRRENMNMAQETAKIKIKDYQTMLDVLRKCFNKYEKGSAEQKILQKEIDKLSAAILKEGALMRSPSKEGITQEKIEKAREYPIDNILPPGRGNRHCLWHNDKTPSMSITKHNKVYCHGCRKHGDAIDVYQAIYGVSFKDAVEALQ